MRKKIIAFIILLTSSTCLMLHAQTDSAAGAKNRTISNGKVEEQKEQAVPLYNGLSAGIDVFGIGNKLFGGESLSTEINLNANFLNRYFPVIEVGYAHTDFTDDTYNIHYHSAAPYARIGMDYNTMAKKMKVGYLTAGLRYGFSAFKYDVNSPDLNDPIWGGTVPFSRQGVRSTAHWIEAVVGIDVKIVRRFHMGWSIRYKARLSVKDSPNASPDYIPGFGKNRSSNFGFTYNLIYKLPF